MRVFKFGGASVKDAKGVKNLAGIIAKSEGELVVVVSAMGKMTNAFEDLTRVYFRSDEQKWEQFTLIRNYHSQIMDELFDSSDDVFTHVDEVFFKIEDRLERKPSLDYDFEYDQLVCYGEILSTKIVSAYLNKIGIENMWIDVRFVLRTNDKWRDASVNWPQTERLMKETFNFANNKIFVTQGFLGATMSDLTTTLGREGSDYTAAIIGSVLKAEKVEIWKDVPGILNADPQYFSNPKKIEWMSYNEAVELTFFGAKVIHPKTIKPLENSGIKLHVRSFLKPDSSGTIIGPANENPGVKTVPVFILKTKQVLITVSQPDFSFMDEKSIAWVIDVFAKLDMKINLIQHSALKLSVSVDIPEKGILDIIDQLSEQFDVRYNDGLELLTIRHYTPEAIAREIEHRTVFVEQRTRRIVRYLVKADIGR